MSLSDVLKKFKSQASSAGMSEEGYYVRAVIKAQAGDTTELDAIETQAVTDGDVDAQSEITDAQSDASTVTSYAGGGGAAGFLGVLSANPGTANADDWWFVNQPEQDPTYITADIGTGVTVNVPNPTLSDLLIMGGGSQDVGSWQAYATGWVDILPGYNGPGTFIVFYDEPNTTIQQIIDALNVWSNANLGKSIATLTGGANGGDLFHGSLMYSYYPQTYGTFSSDKTTQLLSINIYDGTNVWRAGMANIGSL
jgi:hypothetical protein